MEVSVLVTSDVALDAVVAEVREETVAVEAVDTADEEVLEGVVDCCCVRKGCSPVQLIVKLSAGSSAIRLFSG